MSGYQVPHFSHSLPLFPHAHRPSLHAKYASLIPGLEPSAFAPLVRRCAAADPLAVRQLAARALAPLLAPAELAPAISELAALVAAAICGRSGGAGGAALPPANAVHGWLLQLKLLLEGALESEDVTPQELAPGLAAVAAQLG